MAKKQKKVLSAPLSSLLRVPLGPVSMTDFDPAATPGFPGKDRDDAPALMEAMTPELSDLQERLYAHGRSDPEHARSVLVVLQGMDTSGKGGVVRHAIGLVDPQGVQLKSFKAPTAEERAQHYLWRIRKALPTGGMIGIFDRSHYEDVLIVKVHQMVDATTIERRYGQINRFEQSLVDDGYTIRKCFLNISFEEQRERLIARLDDPTKHWKFNEGDIDERQYWEDYQAAYFDAITRCNTDAAPWFAIPSDRKWYRNWAIGHLLLETLREINPQYPDMNLDVARLKARLADA